MSRIGNVRTNSHKDRWYALLNSTSGRCSASQLIHVRTIGPMDKQTVISIMETKFPNCRPDVVGHWLTNCPGVNASGILTNDKTTNNAGKAADCPVVKPTASAISGSSRKLAKD